jgi:SAM-dependent methyltransferase
MDRDTLEYYDRHAAEVADRYELASGGVASFFPFVFEKGERVLDIGAGTCRDAAVLLGLGIDAHAVEPSSGLRKRAAALHPELAGRIFDGSLPGRLPPQVAGPYDGILVSAVLMHVADAQLFDAAFAIRERLKADGKLLVTVPVQRGDLPAGVERDTAGRLMVMRSPAQLKLLFGRLGFTLESEWRSADALGRRGFDWATLSFRFSGTAPRPIDRIESILNADRKVATYKLALLRAFCDTALTSWSQATWEPDGKVSIPLEELSRRWIQYYWPLLESRQLIPQINGESKGAKPIAFRGSMADLVERYRRRGGLGAWLRDIGDGTLSPEDAGLSRRVLSVISRTIVKGPVQFAGGALGTREFSFDSRTRRVLFDERVWQELVLMGHWVRDALVLRWAEMTSRLSGGDLAPGRILDLLIKSSDPLRMDPQVRELYRATPSIECVWTAKPLHAAFEVDHAIPFAFWRDSSLWNLFPAARGANNAKRDRLPTIRLVRRREEAIVGCWRMIAAGFPRRFAGEASLLAGSRFAAAQAGLPQNWERPLLGSFMEAIEYTASTRGAERWEP